MLALEDASPRLRICAKWFLSDLMLGDQPFPRGRGLPGSQRLFENIPLQQAARCVWSQESEQEPNGCSVRQT